MTLQALCAEIQSGPLAATLAPLVQAGDVSGIVHALAQPKPGATRYLPVSVATAMKWAATGPRAAMEDIANTPGHALRASVLVVLDLFKGGTAQPLHLDEPEIRQMFDAWVPAVCTQGQRDALLAAATVPATYAQAALGAEVTAEQVQGALEAMRG